MADWGGIARAVEEGLLDAGSRGGTASDAYGGGNTSLRGLAEALTGSNFAGFKVRDIFDKDRWTRRERVNQGRRLEETGIPDYTYDYNPTDRGITQAAPSHNIGPGTPISGAINQAIQENAPWQRQDEASTPRSGIQNRFGDREFSPRRGRSPLEGRFDRAAASGGGSDQSMGIQGRFGDRTFSPRTGDSPLSGRFDRPDQEAFSQGVTGYLPGRMSVGEARRARAMRNMSQRDRQEAGFGEGPYSEFDRISGQFDDRLSRVQDMMRDWDIKDRQRNLAGGMGGGPSTRIQPDWAALEEDMAMREMADRLQGRDDR